MAVNSSIQKGLQQGRSLGLRYRLALPREALRGRNGVRIGLGAGASLDFHDYRDYHPGDDLRHLDWSVYARSDREVIKLFREEVAPHLDIILDISCSMALQSTPKAYATAIATAACAMAAEQAHCTRKLWLAGSRVEALPESHSDPAGWPPFAFDATESPAEALLHNTPAWRPHGVRVLISDLLWPSEPPPLIGRLAEGAAALTVIQLLTEQEEAPRPQGPCRMEDVESGVLADILVDTTACEAYIEALRRHREAWSTACRGCGATFVSLTAESIVEQGRLLALESCGLLETM